MPIQANLAQRIYFNMEDKTPSRELEQISEIFLSTSKKEELKPSNGFSAVTIREETCESCANMIQGSFREPKCRIFTFENEKYGVPHLNSIPLNFANYCEHYEPETGKHSAELEKIRTGATDRFEEHCEIEETVTVTKKIAFPDTEAAQKDMKNALSRYLESGYTVKSVELEKSEESSKSEGKETKKEQICIFIKEA